MCLLKLLYHVAAEKHSDVDGNDYLEARLGPFPVFAK